MKRLAILLLLSCGATVSVAAPDAADPCVQKRADILRQIEQARQHGNDNRVAGLNRALREQEAHCTPESIRRAREKDVAQARQKLAERERELREARSEGKDAGKIAKREAKLREARDELARTQKELVN
ncbi:DUF1090 domain-containing protein [Pigmentiphaga kullae]|uniref:Uncharacterized protein DUF1090 n=1 Tax=Pigmentiphaga kullae TaxID=151784 RepID=A0A4Q7NEG4_9BURK|nr:DUF1090 domain-containing protein [Pigmentiphaga kullae]RZS81383.1 uncharacterized protein DUF1090 [Pigmentiphaga kullae]